MSTAGATDIPVHSSTTDVAPPTLSRQRSWLAAIARNVWLPLPFLILIALAHRYEFADRPGSYIMHIVMMIGINVILAVSLQLINGVSGQFSLGHAGFMAVGAYLAGYAVNTFAALPDDPDADFVDPARAFGKPGSVLLFFVALFVVAILAGAVLYGVFLAVRKTRAIHPSIPGLLLIVVLAWIAADVASALNHGTVPVYLIWSRAGIVLGQAYTGILVHGAGAADWFTAHVPLAARKPTTFLIALLGGGIAAALAGLVVGLPTLRLRGDYLAIATLGFAEIIRNIIVTMPALGGATGLSVQVYWTRPDPDNHVVGYYILPWIYGGAVLTILLIGRLVRSPKGKALQAVREDEIAAAAMGIDPTHHKVIAFVVGAFFAGVAGGLYVHLDGYLNANSFGFLRSVELVVMVTLGGLGSLWGAVIAAVVLTILPELLRNAGAIMPASLQHRFTWLPPAMQHVAEGRLVVYSLLLILLMLLRSHGLLDVRRLWRRSTGR